MMLKMSLYFLMVANMIICNDFANVRKRAKHGVLPNFK